MTTIVYIPNCASLLQGMENSRGHLLRQDLLDWLEATAGERAQGPKPIGIEARATWMDTTVADWDCRASCPGPAHFLFRDPKIAMLFKLTWGGA